MSNDKLDKLRTAVRNKRDLDLEINGLEDRLQQRKQVRFDLEHKTLPEMFMQARVTQITVAKEGNLPAYKASMAPYYKAVIQADWPSEKQQAAFDLLDKLDLGDLIKTLIEIQFGRNERKETKRFLAAIKKLVRPDQIHARQGVPWGTLTAAIKYRYEHQGQQLGDDELATLGATVGYKVTLKAEEF